MFLKRLDIRYVKGYYGTMEEKNSLYYQGHVIAAAIRLCLHQKGIQPSIRDLSDMTSYSKESLYFICNRLEKNGIVEVVKGAFDEKVYLKNHKRLEGLPKESNNRLDLREDIERLQEEGIKRQKEIEGLWESEAAKKKDLFSELEKKLKGAIKGSEEEK